MNAVAFQPHLPRFRAVSAEVAVCVEAGQRKEREQHDSFAVLAAQSFQGVVKALCRAKFSKQESGRNRLHGGGELPVALRTGVAAAVPDPEPYFLWIIRRGEAVHEKSQVLGIVFIAQ